MLCEERGLFLEIADNIRRSGLTILKGLMEARDGKIWTRFLVEVEKDQQLNFPSAPSLAVLSEHTFVFTFSGKQRRHKDGHISVTCSVTRAELPLCIC
jgi:hypothetical protein